MSLILPARFRQPGGTPKIDWSNPITLGLVFAATNGVDAVTGTKAVYGGSAKLEARNGVMAMTTTNSTSDWIMFELPEWSPLYMTGKNHTLISKIALFNHASNATIINAMRWKDSLSSPAHTLQMSAGLGWSGVPGKLGLYVGWSSYSGNCASPGGPFVFPDSGVLQQHAISMLGGDASFYTNNAYLGVSKLSSGDVQPNFSEKAPVILHNQRPDTTNGHLEGGTEVAMIFNRALTQAEVFELNRNPWQIFQQDDDLIYFDTPSAASDGTGVGSLAPLSLAAPAGTASAATSATASGSVSSLTLAAPTGNAQGSAATSVAIAGLSLSTPTGTASASATAAGSLPTISTTPTTGTASATATAVCSPRPVALTAPTGTASSGSAGIASGTIAPLSLSAPTASISASAAAQGFLNAITTVAPTGTASTTSTAMALGDIAPLRLAAPAGFATTTGSAIAFGDLPMLTLMALTGTASASGALKSNPRYIGPDTKRNFSTADTKRNFKTSDTKRNFSTADTKRNFKTSDTKRNFWSGS